MKPEALSINRSGSVPGVDALGRARSPSHHSTTAAAVANLRLAFAVPAMAFAIFMLSGCAFRKQMTRPPETSQPELYSAADAIGLLLENYGGIETLKVSGRIESTLPGEERQRRASLAALLRRPGSVRMRAFRPLAPLFEFISNGDECWLFAPSQQTAYLSEECEPFRVEGGYVALSAEAVIAAMCVLVDPGALSSPHVSVKSDRGALRVDLPEASGAGKIIWIDPASGLATRQILIGDDGRVEAEIAYLEHEIEAGAAVPVAVEIASPQVGGSATLRIRRFEINSPPPEGAFEFSAPAGVSVFHIDDKVSSDVSP